MCLVYASLTQLVECHSYKVEATGSSPVVRTNLWGDWCSDSTAVCGIAGESLILSFPTICAITPDGLREGTATPPSLVRIQHRAPFSFCICGGRTKVSTQSL